MKAVPILNVSVTLSRLFHRVFNIPVEMTSMAQGGFHAPVRWRSAVTSSRVGTNRNIGLFSFLRWRPLPSWFPPTWRVIAPAGDEPRHCLDGLAEIKAAAPRRHRASLGENRPARVAHEAPDTFRPADSGFLDAGVWASGECHFGLAFLPWRFYKEAYPSGASSRFPRGGGPRSRWRCFGGFFVLLIPHFRSDLRF